MRMSRRLIANAVLGVVGVAAPAAHGIVFVSTGDTSHNTTAPSAGLANSGWQWQGDWAGWYSGTPIAPQFFITAHHTGGVVETNSLTLNGVTYPTVPFPDGSPWMRVGGNVNPTTDLRIWKTSGTFPSYTPLYNTTTDGTELGKTFITFGRGGQRGAEVYGPVASPGLKGWKTAGQNDAGFDHVRRWGQNKAGSYAAYATTGDNQELSYNFDLNGSGNVGAEEATVSLGDSGGGVFILVGSTWKLAAINYGAAGPYSYTAAADPQTDPKFTAALYDRTGLYDWSFGTGVATTGPSFAYASRISPNVSAINTILTAGGSPVWNVDSSGNWGTGSNWWNGTAPGGTSAEAVLGSVITGTRTVTLETNKTIGTLTIDGTNSYVVGGTNTLTVQGATGTGIIRAYAGSHTISAPLTLVGTTQVNVGPLVAGNPNPTLTVSGTLNANGVTIQKQGTGTLVVNNIRGAGLQLQAGKVKVVTNGGNAGVSHLTSLSISAGAALDLNDNDLIVDYGGPTPFSTIQGWVFNGYSTTLDTTKTGIVSTVGQNSGGTKILALFDNALTAVTEWPTGSGMAVPTNSIIGKFTYFGDTDFDGQVTPQDYTAIDANLGATGVDPRIGWFYGDTDFDGNITPQDYTAVDAALGLGVGNPLSAASLAVGSVPEPGLTGVGLLGCVWCLGRRIRHIIGQGHALS
jgi:hypothetical protein